MSAVLLEKENAEQISRLGEADRKNLPQDIRELYRLHHDENWIRSLSPNPATARRFAAYFGSLFGTGKDARLPLHERELIAVVVSSENGCGLCEIHHTLALGDLLDDHPRAKRIALDNHLAPLSEREHAIAAFATKVTRAPKSIGPADFEGLRAVGLDDDDILEALETSAWFNHTNRIFISLGVIPDEKFFNR